ncbi:uncharacterized protein LOC141877278 [Acropora palmata]|uniref:uncharacterized protein LOC141877278 n=1 Tax=Acropora palmata TaxID=6131 RepID=UPI003DA00D7D
MEGTSTADETLASDASPISKPTSTSSSDQTSDVNERNVQARYPRDSLPEASVTPMQQASTSSVADANSGNSSKESCKTPVAPLNEVVIDIEDDEEVKSEDVASKNNSSSQVLYSSGGDSVTKVASDINGNTLEHDNGDESFLGSDSESPSGERIYQSSETQAKMDLMTDSDVKVKSSAVPFPAPPPIPPRPQPRPLSTSKRGKTTGGRGNKEKRRVIREMEGEVHNPSFQQLIQIASSTINQNETTRDSNAKRRHKRNVIKMDTKMMKLKRTKTTFRCDIKFTRSVICGPPAVDHAKNPQMDCACYYCDKHWKRMGGPPCFNRSKPTFNTKQTVVIDGTVFMKLLGHNGHRPFVHLRPVSADAGDHVSPASASS